MDQPVKWTECPLLENQAALTDKQNLQLLSPPVFFILAYKLKFFSLRTQKTNNFSFWAILSNEMIHKSRKSEEKQQKCQTF